MRRGERVELGLVFLRPGGDPGAADPDAVIKGGRGGHGTDRPGSRGAARGSGTGFRDALTWKDATSRRRPGNGRFRDGWPAAGHGDCGPC